MENTELQVKLIEQTDKIIKDVLNQGNLVNNLDAMHKVVDIQKDAYKIKCIKEDKNMRYSNYGRGSYGREAYGEYGRDSYGRRGVDSKYRTHRFPEDALDSMYGAYGEYSASRDSYNRGNYGAKDDKMKSLEYMLESAVDFVKMLKGEVDTQEELTMIDKYIRKMSEM